VGRIVLQAVRLNDNLIEAGHLSKLAPYDALEFFRGWGAHALCVEWSSNQANNRLVKNRHYSYSLPLPPR
jgi:hypothetical protein